MYPQMYPQHQFATHPSVARLSTWWRWAPSWCELGRRIDAGASRVSHRLAVVMIQGEACTVPAVACLRPGDAGHHPCLYGKR